MSNTAQFIICVAGIMVTCFFMGMATGIKVTYEYYNQQSTEAEMASKEKEKDSLEKVSEDIREAQALVASFHARLVEMGMEYGSVFHELRDAVTSLMAARECIVSIRKKEEAK